MPRRSPPPPDRPWSRRPGPGVSSLGVQSGSNAGPPRRASPAHTTRPAGRPVMTRRMDQKPKATTRAPNVPNSARAEMF